MIIIAFHQRALNTATKSFHKPLYKSYETFYHPFNTCLLMQNSSLIYVSLYETMAAKINSIYSGTLYTFSTRWVVSTSGRHTVVKEHKISLLLLNQLKNSIPFTTIFIRYLNHVQSIAG